jgi:hypothetical protein
MPYLMQWSRELIGLKIGEDTAVQNNDAVTSYVRGTLAHANNEDDW